MVISNLIFFKLIEHLFIVKRIDQKKRGGGNLNQIDVELLCCVMNKLVLYKFAVHCILIDTTYKHKVCF